MLSRVRVLLPVLALLALLATGLPAPAAAQDDPVIDNLAQVWERTDSAQVRGDRTFLWGPEPLIPIIDEPLAGVPDGQRAVLYWDKSRMEVNDPAAARDRYPENSGAAASAGMA